MKKFSGDKLPRSPTLLTFSGWEEFAMFDVRSLTCTVLWEGRPPGGASGWQIRDQKSHIKNRDPDPFNHSTIQPFNHSTIQPTTTMSDIPSVSTTNTKAQILKAYKELAALRKQAAEFDTRLQKAVAETEKAVSQRLTREFEYNQKLQAKDLEAELKLSRQEVESLRGKIKEQQELIASLSSKSDTATQQVKDIALKAIENAGARQFQSYPPERRGGEGEKKE